jgi:hypothetical protein
MANDADKKAASVAAWQQRDDQVLTGCSHGTDLSQAVNTGPSLVEAAIGAFAAAASGKHIVGACNDEFALLRPSRADSENQAAVDDFSRHSSAHPSPVPQHQQSHGPCCQTGVSAESVEEKFQDVKSHNELHGLCTPLEKLCAEVAASTPTKEALIADNISSGALGQAATRDEVLELERDLSAARRESENLRLQLNAALKAQVPMRDRDGAECRYLESLPPSFERQRDASMIIAKSSPAREWLNGSEDHVANVGPVFPRLQGQLKHRKDYLRPLHDVSGESLKAMSGLQAHVKDLMTILQKQQMPTRDNIKATQHFVKMLEFANQRWGAAQEQYVLDGGGYIGNDSQHASPNLESIESQAGQIERQIRSLVDRMHALQKIGQARGN